MAENLEKSFLDVIEDNLKTMDNYFTEHAIESASLFILILVAFFCITLHSTLPLILFQYMALDCFIFFATIALLFCSSMAIGNIYTYCKFEKMNQESKKVIEGRYLNIWEETKYYVFVQNKKLISASYNYKCPKVEDLQCRN